MNRKAKRQRVSNARNISGGHGGFTPHALKDGIQRSLLRDLIATKPLLTEEEFFKWCECEMQEATPSFVKGSLSDADWRTRVQMWALYQYTSLGMRHLKIRSPREVAFSCDPDEPTYVSDHILTYCFIPSSGDYKRTEDGMYFFSDVLTRFSTLSPTSQQAMPMALQYPWYKILSRTPNKSQHQTLQNLLRARVGDKVNILDLRRFMSFSPHNPQFFADLVSIERKDDAWFMHTQLDATIPDLPLGLKHGDLDTARNVYMNSFKLVKNVWCFHKDPLPPKYQGFSPRIAAAHLIDDERYMWEIRFEKFTKPALLEKTTLFPLLEPLLDIVYEFCVGGG